MKLREQLSLDTHLPGAGIIDWQQNSEGKTSNCLYITSVKTRMQHSPLKARVLLGLLSVAAVVEGGLREGSSQTQASPLNCSITALYGEQFVLKSPVWPWPSLTTLSQSHLDTISHVWHSPHQSQQKLVPCSYT